MSLNNTLPQEALFESARIKVIKRRILINLAILVLVFGHVSPTVATSEETAFATGFNLAGPEFGDEVPGEYGRHYIYPDADYLFDLANRGYGLIRLPVLWERLQSTPNGPLNEEELSRLDDVVKSAKHAGQNLVIDVHNYGRYYDRIIGLDGPSIGQFASFWMALAERYRGAPHVVFGVMNEPYGIDADHWAKVNQAVVDAIRRTGAENLILVAGTAWSGAFTWLEAVDGRSNAEALATLTDRCNNIVFEAHQYMDTDSSGTSGQCVSATIGSERIADFEAWLRAGNRRGFLGEFGAGGNRVCLEALTDLVATIDRGKDVWMGWSYWASGPWWPEDYHLLVRPKAEDAPAVGSGRQTILDAFAEGVGTSFHGCRADPRSN